MLTVASGVFLLWSLLWSLISGYISPESATQRKDVVNMVVLSAAALVGSITAFAAVGGLILSGLNLRQQRNLYDRRTQEDALQSYFSQMGDLLTTHKLMETTDKDDPLRLLARSHTLTVLRRVEHNKGRTDVARFLENAGLINQYVNLSGAYLDATDLSRANLSGANLNGASLNGAFLDEANLERASLEAADLGGTFLARANLRGAFLSRTNLRGAFLSNVNLGGADLNHADLSGADLIDADLSGADLRNVTLTGAFLSGAIVQDNQLAQAQSLVNATLPDGTRHP